MLTILESINLSAEYLIKKGIESPKLNAELLLAHVLQCKRLDLYLSFDKPLKDEEIKIYRELLKRRSNFEPLQYILGSVEFYGLEFKVNNSVLIPRQETEVLVETIINFFPKENTFSFLDIGTGSGNIAICLAKYFPQAFITTIDVNQACIQLAKENAEGIGVLDRIEFLKADINEFIHPNKFDVIVSNPPYVSSEEFQNLQPEIINYEPVDAVSDFSDGFKFYKLICEKAKSLLKTSGYLFFELGKGQSTAVREIMENNNFQNILVKKDYLNIERVIYGELS